MEISSNSTTEILPLFNANNHNDDTQLMVDLLYTTLTVSNNKSETLGDFMDHICWET